MNKKSQKLLSLLVFLTLIVQFVPFAGFAVSVVNGTNEDVSLPYDTQDARVLAVSSSVEDSLYYGRSALSALANSTALLYAYDQLVEGLEYAESSISIYNGTDGISHAEFNTVMDAYKRDHPEHFWFAGSGTMTTDGVSVHTFMPIYQMTGTELENARSAFEAVVNKLISGVNSGMSEYARELYLHDRLADIVVYSSGDNAHNAYGALVEGNAVCDGYSKALQYLLQRAGIQSFIAHGSSINPSSGLPEGHAWNYVRIDGEFYHVDLTWDDQGENLFHAYFNQSDAVICEDHAIDATSYALPVCDSTSAFYFEGKNTNLDSYTADSVGALFKEYGDTIQIYIPGDISQFLTWYSDNIYGIINAADITDAVGWSYVQLGRELHLTVRRSHVHTPAAAVRENETAATCTSYASWEEVVYCQQCNAEMSRETVSGTEYAPHSEVTVSGKKPTCAEIGWEEYVTCSRCDYTTYKEIPALGHTEVTDEAVAPDCENTGLTEGKHCDLCGKVLVAQTVVDALGHTEVTDEAVAPDCENTGLTEGKHCDLCGKVLAAQTVVDALGHTEVTDEAVAPTCTATGLTEGKHCSVCGKILVVQTVVDALGHTEVTDKAVAPDCENTGLTEGKRCSVCGKVLVAQEVAPALGHSYGEWAAEGDKEIRTCSVCGATEEREIEKPAPIENPFIDVKQSDYFFDPVLWAVNEGITAGYGSAEIFNPDGICTRGQVVTFLWRAAGKPEPASKSNPFTDVVESDFFYTAVLWAVEEGITAGYGSAEIFNPDGNCTRGQVATFLHRYFEKPVPASSANPFQDVAPEAFYYDAVLWAVEQEITNGYGNAYTFAPDQECTRGQIVTFLYRAMK